MDLMLYLKWCAKNTIYGPDNFLGPRENISGPEKYFWAEIVKYFSGPEIFSLGQR